MFGACVCIVAFLHYTWMRNADSAEKIRLRYGDWIVTCPLLLAELHSLTKAENQEWTLLAVVLMIVLGYAAVQSKGPQRNILFSISSLILVAIAVSAIRSAQQEKMALAAFFGLWFLYPIAFILDSNTMYNLLDLASKGLFGLYVATLQ